MNKIKINTGLQNCKPITMECKYAANHTNNYQVCDRSCIGCEWFNIDISFKDGDIDYSELRMIKKLVDKNLDRFHKVINRVEVLKFVANKSDEINKLMNKLTSVCNNTNEDDVIVTHDDFSAIYNDLGNIYSELEDIIYCVDERLCYNYNPYQRFNKCLSSLDKSIDDIIENKEDTNE